MKHNNKNILPYGIILLAALVTGCVPSTPTVSYDENLLYGEWQEGTVHYVFKEGGEGYTWDTSEDITEEEASPFTWSLNNDQLLLTHTLWNGTIVPKTYTITTLNQRTLVYQDSYGNIHEFERRTPY